MYSTFIRIRDTAGNLGLWTFRGFDKLPDYETIYQAVNEDGGQYLSVSFYTSERVFRSRPVPIEIYIKDVLQDNDDWTLNIWQVSSTDSRLVWGLMWRNDPTQMNYELNTILDQDLDFMVEKYPENPRWVFHNGRELYAKKEDLERALKMLI